MDKLKWCVTSEQAAYMRDMKAKNLARCVRNPNENWLAERLEATGLLFTRQATWGYRLFDFWNHERGVAVECDGPEHDPEYDDYRDEYNFRRSAVVVLRVRNLNEEDADKAIQIIHTLSGHEERREMLGIAGGKQQRRSLAKLPYPPSFLKQFLAGQFPFDTGVAELFPRQHNVERFGH